MAIVHPQPFYVSTSYILCAGLRLNFLHNINVPIFLRSNKFLTTISSLPQHHLFVLLTNDHFVVSANELVSRRLASSNDGYKDVAVLIRLQWRTDWLWAHEKEEKVCWFGQIAPFIILPWKVFVNGNVSQTYKAHAGFLLSFTPNFIWPFHMGPDVIQGCPCPRREVQ